MDNNALNSRYSDNQEDLHLNYNYLNESTFGNQEFQKELANIFLSEVPIDLNAIALALSNKDAFTASKIAHSLRSTVGYMGFAHNIGAQLAEFELACLEGKDISLLISAFGDIKNNLEKAKELVNKFFF